MNRTRLFSLSLPMLHPSIRAVRTMSSVATPLLLMLASMSIIATAFVIAVPPAHAQLNKAAPRPGDVVDKIVAVVGSEIIMQSDVVANVIMAAQRERRQSMPTERDFKAALDYLINERLVMTRAIEDSLVASEEEINERIDFQVQNMRAQFGSEKRIEEVYGMPLVKIKREFRDEVRKQILTEKISQQKFASVKTTPRDVQDFFVQYKDSIPKMPPQYDLYHIVKNVDASTVAKERTLALAQRVRDSVVLLGKFADFAKRYSDDPGSKGSGGELGTVNRGNFIAEFEKVAYSLQPNEISLPVETPFGYHVIQLIAKQENSITTRHILFKIGQTTEDADRTKKFLDSIRTVILKADSGKGDMFEQYAKAFSDDTETKPFGGSLGRIEISKLPAEMKTRVESLPDGGISAPESFNAPSSTKSAYHILWRKKFIPEHSISLADDYKRVEQLASGQKRAKLYESWMQDLRKTMYWEMKK
jgi:peptidyl-prolyl cis-trans isomerase SurA